MNIPLISVIVPVYNAEKTLRQCIDSILSQDFKDYELLLVDDGSKDLSPSICDEYALKDNRIRVFHKDNGGVSSARNLGLDHFQGEWVTFVDSDDYVDDCYFDVANKFIDDLLIVPYMWLNEGGKTLDLRLERYHSILEGESIRVFLNKYLTTFILRGPHALFYKKKLIQGIRFNEAMKVGEDIVFVHQYLLKCKSLRCCHHSSYVFRLSGLDASDKYGCSSDYAIWCLNVIFDSFKSIEERWHIDKGLFISYLFYFKMISRGDWCDKPSRWYRNPHIVKLYKYVWSSLSFKQKFKYLFIRAYSVIK